jgi:hypothetical protein
MYLRCASQLAAKTLEESIRCEFFLGVGTKT